MPQRLPLLIGMVITCAALANRTPADDSTDPEIHSDSIRVEAIDSKKVESPGKVRDDNGLHMKLVWCPPGSVVMSQMEMNEDGTPDRSRAPTPVKSFLTRGYWIGRYEVTQSEWTQIMGNRPWADEQNSRIGDDFPATFVNWHDAMEFCRKLTIQERTAGRITGDEEYTLPTEAQWERACRARSEARFSFGDDAAKGEDYAWFAETALHAGEPFPHHVGRKKPNAWGVHDMHGNVWEWCRDAFIQELPGGRDPEVWSDDELTDRVRRGGSWEHRAAICGSGDRYWSNPHNIADSLGFRVVLTAVRPADDVGKSSQNIGED